MIDQDKPGMRVTVSNAGEVYICLTHDMLDELISDLTKIRTRPSGEDIHYFSEAWSSPESADLVTSKDANAEKAIHHLKIECLKDSDFQARLES